MDGKYVGFFSLLFRLESNHQSKWWKGFLRNENPLSLMEFLVGDDIVGKKIFDFSQVPWDCNAVKVKSFS